MDLKQEDWSNIIAILGAGHGAGVYKDASSAAWGITMANKIQKYLQDEYKAQVIEEAKKEESKKCELKKVE